MPKRIQRKRVKGWKMPPNTVSVTRPGRWGNPFDARLLGVDLAIEMFRDQMSGFFDPGKLSHLTDQQFRMVNDARQAWAKRLNYGVEYRIAARTELSGKNLACFCALGSPCHADVLLELANST